MHDILGREITTLVNNKEQLAENYDIYLNVSYGNSRISSGVYIYVLTSLNSSTNNLPN